MGPETARGDVEQGAVEGGSAEQGSFVAPTPLQFASCTAMSGNVVAFDAEATANPRCFVRLRNRNGLSKEKRDTGKLPHIPRWPVSSLETDEREL